MTYAGVMKGKSEYSITDADAIRGILRKLRKADRATQKDLRRRLRECYCFFISDFDKRGRGFTEAHFDALIENGIMRIENWPATRDSPAGLRNPKSATSLGSAMHNPTQAPILPDMLHPDLDLLICGMAAGPRSAATGTYYAGKGNRFWRTLHETGLTPRQLVPEEFATLTGYGIGLTDLAKHASGTDADLNHEDFDVRGFWQKVLSIRPGVLAFNGKEAAKVALEQPDIDYGSQAEPLGKTVVFVLPSTSGSARRYWDIRHWLECARLTRSRQ